MKMALIYDPLNDIDLISSSNKSGGSGEREKGGKTQRAHPTLNPTLHQTAPGRTAESEQPDEYERANSKEVSLSGKADQRSR